MTVWCQQLEGESCLNPQWWDFGEWGVEIPVPLLSNVCVHRLFGPKHRRWCGICYETITKNRHA